MIITTAAAALTNGISKNFTAYAGGCHNRTKIVIDWWLPFGQGKTELVWRWILQQQTQVYSIRELCSNRHKYTVYWTSLTLNFDGYSLHAWALNHWENSDELFCTWALNSCLCICLCFCGTAKAITVTGLASDSSVQVITRKEHSSTSLRSELCCRCLCSCQLHVFQAFATYAGDCHCHTSCYHDQDI